MLYQTNENKNKLKVEIRKKLDNLYTEAYIYKPGFFRFNWHKSYEVLTVLSGTVDVYVNGKTNRLECDDIAVINPQDGHATLSVSEDARILLLHFLPENISQNEHNIPIFDCFSCADTRYNDLFSKMRFLIASLYRDLFYKDDASIANAIGSQYILSSILLRNFQTDASLDSTLSLKDSNMKKLSLIFDYTNEHYSERININDLAIQLNMNSSYFSAFFREHVGITYSEYISRKRLQHALHLLNNTSMTLPKIAESAGLANVQALNSIFKRYFEMTPGQYKKTTETTNKTGFKTQYPEYFDINDFQSNLAIQRYLGYK